VSHPKTSSLISPSLLRRLEQLSFLCRKRARSSQKGERKSQARGQSVEFADHRNYVPGDDLRYLDWNLFGRLDRLFLKTYEEERELPLHLFLDGSRSMDFGEPSKFKIAQKIAAAMGVVALSGYDRLLLNVFPENQESALHRHALGQLRGKSSIPTLLEHLSHLTIGEGSSLNQVLQQEAQRCKTQGTVIILSDFMDASGYEKGLKAWCGKGMEVHAFMVLSPEELEPTLRGDLRLVDCEDGTSREVTFGRHRLKAYKATLQRYLEQITSFCQRHGIGFHLVPTDTDLESWLMADLRKAMLWQ